MYLYDDEGLFWIKNILFKYLKKVWMYKMIVGEFNATKLVTV